jgi:hypothetical protein
MRLMNELDTFYDEVSKVAYGLFEKRGKVHGHDMEDWLQSEMIVKKRYTNRNDQAAQVDGSRGSTGPDKIKK